MSPARPPWATAGPIQAPAACTELPGTVGEATPGDPDERLRHLFRASLREGRIHPLYLHVLRYRQAQRAGVP